MKDVGKYVDECDMCQRMKNRTETTAGKLMANEVPEKVWTHLTVDFQKVTISSREGCNFGGIQ